MRFEILKFGLLKLFCIPQEKYFKYDMESARKKWIISSIAAYVEQKMP